MKSHSTKYFAFIGAALAILLFISTNALAGDLEPTAAPDNATSAMYTLEDVYNYLDTGTPGTKRPGAAQEPGASPAATGHTLDELHKKVEETCFETCDGTLHGTRWCDQGDGTVKDMTTGLIWLKNADCFWLKPWNDTDLDDAHTMSGTLESGSCGLTDGSVVGDWRLPTKSELQSIGMDPPVKWSFGTPSVTWTQPGAPFTNVQSDYYWSSTTNTSATFGAGRVIMHAGDGSATIILEGIFYVWPVRSDN